MTICIQNIGGIQQSSDISVIFMRRGSISFLCCQSTVHLSVREPHGVAPLAELVTWRAISALATTLLAL
jgi:hypothetical protein